MGIFTKEAIKMMREMALASIKTLALANSTKENGKTI
jgi:hypothetical protein